jgi:ribonuclease P protein component
MKKINIVKESKDFDEIIKSAFPSKNNFYIIYSRENDLNRFRFGISVGKKLGNAVTRNKLKRQLRNIIDKNKKVYQNNQDYIIIVRKSCLGLSFQKLEEKFLEIFQ